MNLGPEEQAIRHGMLVFAITLATCQGGICLDPRDKVFAIVGLTLVQKKLPLAEVFTVDYAATTEIVYLKATSQILTKSQRPDLTALKGTPERHDADFKVLSWCPDYRTSSLGCTIFAGCMDSDSDAEAQYQAVSPVPARDRYIEVDGDTLQCFAGHFEVIEGVYDLDAFRRGRTSHGLLDFSRKSHPLSVHDVHLTRFGEPRSRTDSSAA
jgi:hypothetical protein